MSKNTVRLISDAGTSYYLSGGANTQTAYAGSGTPWTSESTSPYELSYNDVTGAIWVPTPAPAVQVYSGGPPFALGARPVYRGYTNVTETVGLQLKATSKDNAIALLRQLRQVLNTALFSVPCILAVQGGTNTGYTEIYGADVQESALYLVETNNWRATIAWTRAPFFGLLSSGETLLNAVSFDNDGTGSPDNIAPYSTGTGDLIAEGSPLNVAITPGSGSFSRMYAASIASRTYTTTGAGTYATTSTTGSASHYTLTHTLTSVLTSQLLKPRVMVRLSTFGANVQIRMSVFYDGSTIYTGPWVTPDALGAGIFDLGTYPVDIFRRRANGITSPDATMSFETRSTNGASASVTVTYTELILYYTWARLEVSNAVVTNLAPLILDTFQEQTGAACLPHQIEQAFTRNSNNIDAIYTIRGQLPRYYSGASLYLAWLNDSIVHSASATATVTATHAPLYHTVRGAS